MPNATVLVAEDDELIRNIFVELVKAEGFDVIEAADGQKALEVMASRQVDVIISDMRMPIIDGYSLLLTVKEAHPELPVIVITGFDNEYPEADAIAAGASAYITKPFKVIDVTSALRQACLKIAPVK